MADLAVPGQVLETTTTHLSGPGTHVHDGNIVASLVGSSITVPAPDRSSKPTITIPQQGPIRSPTAAATPTLPTVSSIVLCRVLRVQQRQLVASILLTAPSPESTSLDSGTVQQYPNTTNEDLQFQATLRKEDIRFHEKDKVVMNDMFRVGDIIRATVLSLGDERNYYISTAGNELGVLIAKSEAGNAMVPSSWREMRDVVTGKGEPRKVAKPT
jgi:exosome complex component CSL4